jgi:hypothetical protein
MIIVNRIAGKFDIPIKLIKGKVRDGVVLVERDGVYSVDEGATEKRSGQMKDAWEE